MAGWLRRIPLLIFILSSSAILNSVGLYLLHKDGRRQTNQHLILKFLSGCEIVLAVISILRWVLKFQGFTESDRVLQIVILMVYADSFNYSCVMIFMTLDRLIATKYPFRYCALLLKRKARTILFSCIFVCGVIGCISLLVDYASFKFYIDSYVFFIISTIATVTIVVTYAYILVKVTRQRRSLAPQDNIRNRVNMDGQRCLKMAIAITASFILCFLVPDMLFVLFYEYFANFNANIIFITWYLGLLFDPIIYIFMQKRLRDLLLEKLWIQSCRRNTAMNRNDAVLVPGIPEDQPWVVETML